MMQAVEKRFGANGKLPQTIEWLTDNESCYTAAETRSFARQLGLRPVTTPVTIPQSKAWQRASSRRSKETMKT